VGDLSAIFFADRVDKPTDNKTSQCFATATDASSLALIGCGSRE
jgi:hypothetical protein